MFKKSMALLKKLGAAFMEFQDYRWQRGSSCCLPAYSELEHNPFRFDSTGKPGCRHQNHPSAAGTSNDPETDMG